MQFANPVTDSAFRVAQIFVDPARVVSVSVRVLTLRSGRGGKPLSYTLASGRTLDVIYTDALKRLQDDMTAANDTLLVDTWSDVASALLTGFTFGALGSGPITLTLVGLGMPTTPPGVSILTVRVG